VQRPGEPKPRRSFAAPDETGEFDQLEREAEEEEEDEDEIALEERAREPLA